MTYHDITALILIVVTFVGIVYDVWVKYKDPTGDSTISWIILSSSKKWPAIAFAFGFLCGHLFFQNCAVNG